ncbi:eukaryotic translation initiation factor 2-alpha kinase [Neocucurbitaria cava]|uniref:non-specific serine/threonine protein kinase n=1 Tax=Neocucurbitaria cava TaxID=798079 RepID=A0A9W8Y5E5_9PLEO|nr:eukaryotic translation initiation factor 2-alpha kinase [Neocucurbitaria cava]
MAPHKTPRNKKHQQNVFAQNGNHGNGTTSPVDENLPIRPPMVSQPSETYEKAQEDEREVLKAIFMDDYEESEAKGAWSKTTDRVLRLKLKSFSNDDISVTLCAKITATYPKSLPTLTLEDGSKLRKSTWDKLRRLLKTRPKELTGEVMIHEIATAIQDILEDEIAVRENDGAFENLDAERAVQEAEAAEVAKQQEEELRKKRDEEKAEEERVLQQMVSDEMRRKDLMAKRKNRASGITPTSYFPSEASANTVSFDRAVFLQHEDTMVDCSTVEGLIPFRTGPVTEVQLVKPVGSAIAITLVLKRARVGGGNSAAGPQLKKAIMEFEEEMEEIKKVRQTAIMTVLDFKIEHLPGSGWEINVLMEHANKTSLGEKLEDDGQIPVARVRSWTIELLEALDFLHRNGVVHKRIHPSNILLRKSTTGSISVNLADAGFQESLHNLRNLCRGEQPVATSRSAFWVAAEHAQDTRRTRKTDVWDLGVVFLQMLFGLDAPQKYNSPKDLSDTLGCSEPLQEIMRKFFKPDPKKRPSAFDLIPCEFLRDDVSVYERPPTPMRSRHSSTSLGHYKLRRESSTGVGGSYSRYAIDWVEQGRLGKGGYGEVVKARNKVDGRVYAIKKIKQKSAAALTEVLSEVMLLSRLNHSCVVRYYTAWPEEDIPGSSEAEEDESTTFDGTASESDSDASQGSTDGMEFGRSTGGLDFISSSGYPKIEFGSDAESDGDEDGAIVFGSDSEGETGTASAGPRSPLVKKRTMSNSNPTRPSRSILYIQMEFCERQTLRDLIRRDLHDDPDEYWRLFRQILEGLAHIHGHEIIHRDLKPDNIFIDFAKIPKIGDFGLATSGQYQRPDKKVSAGIQDGDMTRSVGTALYVAPELSSNVTGNYNNKVDMYSMGIIFFEMCFPLKTAMERDKVIRSLRERKHDLPKDFETPEKSLQGSIMTSLISHRPSERPSCVELLRSGKVPVQIEDEAIKEALKALSDRNSPHYAKMMAALFSQKPDTQAKDYAWDLGVTAQTIKANDVLLQNLVKDRLAMVFRSHGAIEVQRQILLPWSDHYTNSSVVKLFDPSGTLVQLPYDLTLPYARSIGRGAPFLEKTFTIGQVYRDNYGGAPRSSGEADFDILSYDTLDLALKEAEVMKVVDEIIDEFPSFGSTQMCFHLNHSDLLETIMEFCRISAPQRPAVKTVLSKLNISKNNWQVIRNELRSSDIGVSSTSLEDLARFDWRDTPDKAFQKLRRIFEGTKYLGRTHAIFAHLSSVVNYMKLWNVRRKIYISVLSSFNEKFYTGGILFQCLFDTKQREVLAAGGRYDKLIEEYRPRGPGHTQSRTGYHAVGINLGWDRLANSMTRYLKKPEKSTFLKKHAEEDTPSISWMPRRCDCLVASFDPNVLRTAGIRMVADLISHGYTAELAIDAHSIEDILRHYRDDRHSWVIIIKHGLAPDKPELKVKSIAKKEDTDLRTGDLLNYLRNELRDREGREGSAAQRMVKATPTASTPTTSSAKSNVDVLIAQHRSKKSNKWSIVEAAQARSTELLSVFQSAPIAAIETKEEVMNLIKDTRLSDPDSWRHAIQKMPIAERKYLQELHDLLLKYKTRWETTRNEDGRGSGEVGKAFVYNFRTGGCLLYDLES